MLTDAAVRSAKPAAKTYRLHDDRGMYLEVRPSGAKYWRMKYRIHGRERRFALGVYPDVKLARARLKRDDARSLVARGIDPCLQARQVRREASIAAANTFEAVAKEWHAKCAPGWADFAGARILRRLELDVFPWIGKRPIAKLDAPEIFDVVKRVEARGAGDTAHRILQYCSRIFRFAIATSRARRDPAADLRGHALAPTSKKHFSTITDPERIGQLLRAMDAYVGTITVRAALHLAPLLFLRPGELRQIRWSDVNFMTAEIRIPAERMKMRELHIVPLSRQGIIALQELHKATGSGEYLFPSYRSPKRPISNNAVNAALRSLGYSKAELTGHGFRSMASTLLNEHGWNYDVIERQLSHCERNKVRGAYNYAQYLPERRKMMQAWADYLDRLRAGATSATSSVA